MTGYVAVERLGRAEIRFGLVRTPPESRQFERAQVEIEDLVHDASAERLTERIDDLRALWRQTTFFLFDPQGWR